MTNCKHKQKTKKIIMNVPGNGVGLASIVKFITRAFCNRNGMTSKYMKDINNENTKGGGFLKREIGGNSFGACDVRRSYVYVDPTQRPRL